MVKSTVKSTVEYGLVRSSMIEYGTGAVKFGTSTVRYVMGTVRRRVRWKNSIKPQNFSMLSFLSLLRHTTLLY